MKITIKGKEIELKQTFRTLMIYENIAQESFTFSGNLTNIILYFYCNVLATNEITDLSFDDFVTYLDQNNDVLSRYIKWLEECNRNNVILSFKSDEKDTEKKSKKKKNV